MRRCNQSLTFPAGIRGMITTNINDYAIQPNGLHNLVAEPVDPDEEEFLRKQHSIKVEPIPPKFKDMKINSMKSMKSMRSSMSPTSLSPGHPLDPFKLAPPRSSAAFEAPFHTDKLPRETPPRRLESELALIVDKEFQEKYEEDFPDQPDQKSLILFLAETINWMQMWWVKREDGPVGRMEYMLPTDKDQHSADRQISGQTKDTTSTTDVQKAI